MGGIIHRVLRIIKGMNVQIDFDPVLFRARVHAHAQISMLDPRSLILDESETASPSKHPVSHHPLSGMIRQSACEALSSTYHSRVTFSRSGGGMADTYV